MSVCFITVIIGYQYDSLIFRTVGFSIMFIVNFAILFTGIDYTTGTIAVYNNLTATTTTTDVTSTHGTHWIGFLLAVVGLFGATWATWNEVGLK